MGIAHAYVIAVYDGQNAVEDEESDSFAVGDMVAAVLGFRSAWRWIIPQRMAYREPSSLATQPLTAWK